MGGVVHSGATGVPRDILGGRASNGDEGDLAIDQTVVEMELTIRGGARGGIPVGSGMRLVPNSLRHGVVLLA